MKRLFATIAGTALLVPLTAAAADTNLYEIFREQVTKEHGQEDQVDEPVVEFLQGVYQDKWGMGLDEVKDAIRGKPWLACAVDDDAMEVEWKRDNIAECDRALKNIQLLAEEEQDLRVFGRALMRASSAQELPLTEFPGRPFHLATDLSGILNIWRAGTGSVKQTVSGAVLVRTRILTKSEVAAIKEPFQALAGALTIDEGGLNQEYGVAQMAYYQYGALLRSGARSPTYPPPLNDGLSGPGTERQYLFKNDFKAGVYLEALWSKLPRGPKAFDPPLAEGEVAYFLFPKELTDLLPENVVVWARMDAGKYEPGVGEKNWLGDAGVAWKYPIEPVLPSLLSSKYEPGVGDVNSPILGGRYPPEPATPRSSNDDGSPAPLGAKEPIDGRGLCSMAVAQRGYLCRPFKATSEQLCPPTQDAGQQDGENVITLVSCTLDEKPTLTVAGADVCREIGWQKPQAEGCTVEVSCGACSFRGKKFFSFTDSRQGKTIPVCIDDGSGIPATYMAQFALTHAQYLCNSPTGKAYYEIEDKKEREKTCCAAEGAAASVLCKRFFADGVLDQKNTLAGVRLDEQACMEAIRNRSCQLVLDDESFSCPSITAYPDEFVDQIFGLAKGNPADVPESCEDIAQRTEKMDAQVRARMRTIERQRPICTPGTETTYKNTIGNNACYIGQCVEESLELHRLTAGRSPATVGDEAFPYDDPDTGDALGTLLRSVPATSPPLPSYRPELVAHTLENALCQLQGLPAATPPHLCAFSPSRRLAIPLGDPASTEFALSMNIDEQEEATILTEQLASGLGSRIGTDMQGQYLRVGTRTLSEVVALANKLLKEAITVTFPTNMCPLAL